VEQPFVSLFYFVYCLSSRLPPPPSLWCFILFYSLFCLLTACTGRFLQPPLQAMTVRWACGSSCMGRDPERQRRWRCAAKHNILSAQPTYRNFECIHFSISNRLDVTLLSFFLFWQLYMFQAFFAHLQELIYCMGSRWL
jgi:hypothetical protein